MKIAITGYSGSGKSTAAKILGNRYGIPVLHLGRIHWLPGWRERNREDEKQEVRRFLDTNLQWIIDGNYTRHF